MISQLLWKNIAAHAWGPILRTKNVKKVVRSGSLGFNFKCYNSTSKNSAIKKWDTTLPSQIAMISQILWKNIAGHAWEPTLRTKNVKKEAKNGYLGVNFQS